MKSHLLHDHKVLSEEIGLFLTEQSGQIKSNKYVTTETSQPKSKIFIKDVTLLRKPDLPDNVAIPNIFDSLDLTTEDDILDDFLATDDHDIVFDDDFDFEDSANLNNIPEVEIVNPPVSDPGKIFVRKNLCESVEDATTSKIFVRSHESLTSQVITTNVTKQPSEASTPDCIIVSSEIIKEAPNAKIFIRDIETLQEASANQLMSHMSYPPTIYDSLRPEPGSSPQVTQQRCKISIKNMNTLIEPNLMQPPLINASSMIFGQAQNLVIHMRTQQTDEGLMSYRDTNMTPDTLPGSSNVSTCGGTDDLGVLVLEPREENDVIVLDDTETFFNAFSDAAEIVKLMGDGFCEVMVSEHPPAIETPERNETPNEKTVLESLVNGEQKDVARGKENAESAHQPMVSIPIEFSEPQNFLETQKFVDKFQNFQESNPLQKLQETLNSQKFENSTNFLEPEKFQDSKFQESSNFVDSKFQNSAKSFQDSTMSLDAQAFLDSQSFLESQTFQELAIFPESQDSQKSPERKKMKIVKIIKVKTKQVDEISNKVNFQVIFKCSIDDCTQHFSTESLLKYHKKCHRDEESKTLICPDCKSEDFKSFNTLHTHLWRQHKIDMDLYACNLCEFKTPILSRLKNFHEKIHLNERNFKCECGKSFKNSKQLKNHAQIHKKNSAKTKAKPQKVEDSEKKLRCPDCNKGFSSESGLYIHSMEHKNDEKKFNCGSCEYSTNDHNSFRRHKAQHSQLHHYKCPSCDYTSIQSNTYRKHLEKQHPELAESLLYKCTACKFTTISKAKYDGHLTKHGDSDGEINRKRKIKVKSNQLLTDPASNLPNQANKNL